MQYPTTSLKLKVYKVESGLKIPLLYGLCRLSDFEDLLKALDDSALPSIGVQLHHYFIPNKDFDAMQTHFTSQVADDDFPISKFYSKHGAR